MVREPWSLVPGRGTIIRGFSIICSSRVGVGSGFRSRGPLTTDRGRVGSGRVGVSGQWAVDQEAVVGAGNGDGADHKKGAPKGAPSTRSY